MELGEGRGAEVDGDSFKESEGGPDEGLAGVFGGEGTKVRAERSGLKGDCEELRGEGGCQSMHYEEGLRVRAPPRNNDPPSPG